MNEEEVAEIFGVMEDSAREIVRLLHTAGLYPMFRSKVAKLFGSMDVLEETLMGEFA